MFLLTDPEDRIANSIAIYEDIIADYSRAIELDHPDKARILTKRGRAKFSLADLIAGAAVQHQPPGRASGPPLAKAEAAQAAGRATAIADYNRAIELDPENATYYILRGKAKNKYTSLLKKDAIARNLESMMADYNRAIELARKAGNTSIEAAGYTERSELWGRWYQTRKGSSLDSMAVTEDKKAIADIKQAVKLNPWYASEVEAKEAILAITKDSRRSIEKSKKETRDFFLKAIKDTANQPAVREVLEAQLEELIED